jgi:hypothetical protein
MQVNVLSAKIPAVSGANFSQAKSTPYANSFGINSLKNSITRNSEFATPLHSSIVILGTAGFRDAQIHWLA